MPPLSRLARAMSTGAKSAGARRRGGTHGGRPAACQRAPSSLDPPTRAPDHRAALTQFLQSNVSLVAGAVLLLIILGIRALTGDRDLRSDLRASAWLLFAFLALRMSAWLFESQLTGTPANLLRLSWMLTFAFGTIRAVVSTGLWALRFRRSTPTPQIVRDFVNFI